MVNQVVNVERPRIRRRDTEEGNIRHGWKLISDADGRLSEIEELVHIGKEDCPKGRMGYFTVTR
jgi:hypothetical protein